MSQEETTATVVEDVIVNPDEGIDFMSYLSLKPRLESVKDVWRDDVDNVFKCLDEEVKAIDKSEKTTLEWCFDMTAEGITKNDMPEFVEGLLKEAGLWPTWLNPATRMYEPRGWKTAAKISLAGKLYNRIKTFTSNKSLIVDSDGDNQGMMQFYNVGTEADPRYITKTEKNTDEEGNFTTTAKKGGQPSIEEAKIARAKSTSTRTVNPAEEKKKAEEAQKATEEAELQSSEQAKQARLMNDNIAQSFGNLMKGLLANQKKYEERRTVLSKRVSKQDLEFLDNLFATLENLLYDHADVLKITEKNGKYVANL